MAKKQRASTKATSTKALAKTETKGVMRIVGGADIAGRSQSYSRYSDAWEILSKVYGYAAICADIQAQFVASQTLRLFKRSGSPTTGRRKGVKGVSVARKTYLRNPLAVGGKTASWADQSDELQEITQADVLRLLHKPNDDMSGWDFAYMAQFFRSTVGNSYQQMGEKESGDPALFLLYPQYTKVEMQDWRFVGWQYGARGDEQFVPKAEILHQRFKPSRFHPIFGESPLHSVLIAVDILNAQNVRELVFQENNARPDYAIKVPLEATDQQIDDTETEWRSRLGGPRGEGKFVVLRDSEIQPLGFKPKDLEGMNLRREMKQEIFAAYGVPESEMALNDANLASSKTGNLNFYRKIRPLLIKNAEELTAWLIPQFYEAEEGEYFFAYDDIMPADSEPQVAPEAQISLGLLTINEWRQENGYDAVEGGDVPRFSGVPLHLIDAQAQATALATVPPTLPTPEPDEPEPSGGVTISQREPDESAPVSEPPKVEASETKSAATVEEIQAEPLPVPLPSAEERVAEQERIWKSRIHLDTKTELPFAKAEVAALQRALEETYGEVAESLSVDSEGKVSLGEFETKLKARLREKLPATFQRGGQDGLVKLSKLPGGAARLTELGVSFDVVPERALAFLDSYCIRLAKEITETQESDLREAIKSGLEGGESISDITARVKSAIGDSGKPEVIARTETARAYCEGQSAAWREAEVSKVKPILAPKPCPICVEKFNAQKDGISIDAPRSERVPFHPQCRCDEVPVLD